MAGFGNGFSLGGLFTRVRRNPAPTEQVGELGTQVIGGFIQEHETNASLVGQKRYQTFSNILANTSIVAASIRYYLNLVSKVSWRAEPVDPNDRQADEAAQLMDYVMQNITHLPWHRVVRRAAMYRFHGFSIQEWTARKIEVGDFAGGIGLADIGARPQVTIERWDLDKSGHVQGVIQRSVQNGAELYLPRAKIVYAVDDALNDSPQGLGLARHLVDTVDRLSVFQLLESYGFEIDLRGIPIGRGPFGLLKKRLDEGQISQKEHDRQVAGIKSFLEKHLKNPKLGLLLDSAVYASQGDNAAPSGTPQWDLSLLQGQGTGAEPVAAAITRLQRECARILGTEFLLLGDGQGSQALSRDKTQTFGLIVESALQELREVENRDVVRPVMELNGIPEPLWPELRTDSVQYRDVEQVTKALVDMATAGAIMPPDDPAINVVRQLLGLPDQPEDMGVSLLSLAQPAPPEPGAPEPAGPGLVPDPPDPDAMPQPGATNGAG